MDEEKKDGDKAEDEKKEKEVEPNFELLSNPARVMKAQLKVINLDDGITKQFYNMFQQFIVLFGRSLPPDQGHLDRRHCDAG